MERERRGEILKAGGAGSPAVAVWHQIHSHLDEIIICNYLKCALYLVISLFPHLAERIRILMRIIITTEPLANHLVVRRSIFNSHLSFPRITVGVVESAFYLHPILYINALNQNRIANQLKLHLTSRNQRADVIKC